MASTEETITAAPEEKEDLSKLVGKDVFSLVCEIHFFLMDQKHNLKRSVSLSALGV